MNGIISWWAKNGVAANLLMVGILIAGIVGFSTIERELEPYVEAPGAQISIAWLGASPQDIEEQIVVRVEEAVSRIDGIDQMWAEASEGLGQLWVIGDDDLDEAKFLQDLKRQIDSINTFPAAAEPAQMRLFNSRNEMVRIAVRGDVDERVLKRYADKLRREISLLPSVPSVELFGVRDEEVSIEISEDELRRYGLTFSDIVEAVRGTSVNISAGNVRTALGDMQLRTRKLADTQSDFENIIVRQLANGAVVRLDDVATVRDGFEEVNLLATVNGEHTILVQVMSGPKMDVVKLSREVEAYLEEERPNAPEGITLTVWENQEDAYTGRINTITSNFLTGLVLVFITLLLFLRPIIAIWVAMGIAIAFAGGIAFLPMFNVSFNMISSFAFLLVIGVIVDDAIIVGEAIHTKIEDGETGVDAAINGTKMVIMPVVFAVLTTMIFFAPWMMIGGTTAEFTRAISLVVILALTFSLVETLLILPSHLSHLYPIKPQHPITRFQNRIANSVVWFARNIYKPAISAAIRRRYLTAACFVAAMILSVGLLMNGIVRTSFMPEIESDQIEITVNLPQGMPYARTLEVLEQIQIAEKALVDEVNSSSDGGGELIENWYTRSRDNQVLALVKLVPPETRSLTAKETAERLRALIGDVPDAETISVEYQNNGGGPPIEYVLNSKSLEDLNAAAEDLMAKLRSFDGVYNVVNDTQSSTDEIRFDLKPGAEALGVTTADVARQVRQGFYGEEVQRLPRDGQDVRVFVRYPRTDRESLDHLKNMRIRTNDGRELPLYTVADIEFADGITRILRRERQRAVIVSAEVESERIEEIRGALSEEYFEEFDTRHPTVARGNIGRAQGQAEFVQEILILGLIAIGVAYFLVAVAFKSYFEPILILFAAIPFCFTGAVIGHLMLGLSLSLFSYLGIMAAAGVAVNDNLVLIDYINRLRAKGMDGAEAVVEAGAKRFRPILLTSLTTFVGLLPLMMERSIQAAFLVPVGVGLSFGVLFALFVTLFFVPALYGIGADIRRFFIYVIKGAKQPDFDAKLVAAHDHGVEGGKPVAI
jgi:multidrug efflux pump subunit AcrB